MDNLKQISDKVNQDIDPNGAVGSILAQNHNDILQKILTQTGRSVGMPYEIVVKNDPSTLNNGECSFSGSIGDKGISFDIKNITKDGNSALTYFLNFQRFDYFHFKDFEGRSYVYQIKLININATGGFTSFYLYGYSSNPVHTYPPSSKLPVIIEWIKGVNYQSLVDNTNIELLFKKSITSHNQSIYNSQYSENFYDVNFQHINGTQITVNVAKLFSKIENHEWLRIKDLNPKIIVERWTRGGRRNAWNDSGTIRYTSQSSSYKQDLTTSDLERPSVIDLRIGIKNLNLKPEKYFRDNHFPKPKGVNGTMGLTVARDDKQRTRKGYIHLRFKLRISANGRKYFSAPFGHIKIIGHANGRNKYFIRYSHQGKS